MPLKNPPNELLDYDVKRVKDDNIQKHLGNMNMPNPMKVTSNTMVSNPTRVASFYLHGKDFSDCNNDERIEVYNLANNSGDQMGSLVTSHELHKREKKTRKREVTNMSPLEMYKSTYGAAGYSTIKNGVSSKPNHNAASRRSLNKTPT